MWVDAINDNQRQRKGLKRGIMNIHIGYENNFICDNCKKHITMSDKYLWVSDMKIGVHFIVCLNCVREVFKQVDLDIRSKNDENN